ncbi:MAG: hypothetical protein OXH81_21780 [Gemmatimonadetes bacterium]|nr:hypothetical protein [Gemmatimonadota bacterium]MDE2734334.1 hypothetical protein [Gemmatimonadota bacterium]
MKIDNHEGAEGAAKRDLGRGFAGRRMDVDVGHIRFLVHGLLDLTFQTNPLTHFQWIHPASTAA